METAVSNQVKNTLNGFVMNYKLGKITKEVAIISGKSYIRGVEIIKLQSYLTKEDANNLDVEINLLKIDFLKQFGEDTTNIEMDTRRKKKSLTTRIPTYN